MHFARKEIVMKIERVNENQIRCTLNQADLASRQLKISELAYGSEKAKDGENIQRNINKSADSKGSFTEKADISRTSVNENDVSGIRNAMEDIGKKSNLSGSDKKGD